jgi:hypothetical protein
MAGERSDQERGIITIEDQTLRAGFTQWPNILWGHPCSPGAKLAYLCLLSYAWQQHHCFPGQERMGRDMGCSVKSVQRYLQELEDHRLIVITRRGLTKTNDYYLPTLSTE